MSVTKSKKAASPADPATAIGSLIDALYTMREKRLGTARKLDEMKKEEQALKRHIMDLLRTHELEGGRGKKATASITQSEVPTIEDWDEFIKYVFKTKDDSLLWRRCNQGSVEERWADAKEVPGVVHRTVEDLSLSKAA